MLTRCGQEETEVVWDQLVSDPANRRPQARGKPAPSYGDFTDSAIEDALQRVTENASEQTRPLFNRGADPRGDRYWPARWLLYHLFRNRDMRNKSRTRNPRPSPGLGGGADNRGRSRAFQPNTVRLPIKPRLVNPGPRQFRRSIGLQRREPLQSSGV